VQLGQIGGIGANLETKVITYCIIRSDRPSGGAAPLRRAKRSLNTNPLGFGGSLDDVLAALRRLGLEKMLKNRQKWAFARQKRAKNGQKWVFAQQQCRNGPPGALCGDKMVKKWYASANPTDLRCEYASLPVKSPLRDNCLPFLPRKAPFFCNFCPKEFQF